MLSLCLQVSCTLHVTGGATDSVFPKVDELLQNTEVQEALEFIAPRSSMERYESMVDFILCEIFTQFRKPCLKFYRGEGEPFRNLIESGLVPEKDRAWCEKVLVHGLGLAHQAFVEKRNRKNYPWKKFREETLSLEP